MIANIKIINQTCVFSNICHSPFTTNDDNEMLDEWIASVHPKKHMDIK